MSGEGTVLWLFAEQDIATLPVLAEALAVVLTEAAGDVVIDLAMVEFIDASTIGALAHAHHLLRCQSRRLTVRSPSPCAQRVIEVCQLTHLLDDAPQRSLRSRQPSNDEQKVERVAS